MAMVTRTRPEVNRTSVDEIPVPAWITNERCAKQFRLGVTWFHCGQDERIPGALTEQYLLSNLKLMSEKGLFHGKHDEWALEHLGFIFGMLSQQS
jgi:hypothetical protein